MYGRERVLSFHLTTLADPIQFIIFNLLPARDIFALELTCRRLAQLLTDEGPDGAYLWAQKAALIHLPQTTLLSPRRLLALVSLRGCQICQRPRIRKVFWMFLVRCCDDCFQSHTIRHYVLDREKLAREYASLPTVQGEGYSSSTREICYYRYYWRADLVDEVPTEEQLQARRARLHDLYQLHSDMSIWESDQVSYKRQEGHRYQEQNRPKIDDLVGRLEPKIEWDILQRCKAYQNALKKQDKMTSRSLTLLAHKLPKEAQQVREELRQIRLEAERQRREHETEQQRRQRDYRLVKMVHQDLFSPAMGYTPYTSTFPLHQWFRYSHTIINAAINAGGMCSAVKVHPKTIILMTL